MVIRPRRNVYNNKDRKKGFIVFEFFKAFGAYLGFRARQVFYFSQSGIYIIADVLDNIKSWTVQRMFWGRSSLYRSSFHTIVSIITIIAVFSGISSRLNISAASENVGLDINTGIIGRQDIFSQLGSAESIGVLGEDEKDYPEYIHEVQKNETLSEIAEIYQININTIKWANSLKSEVLTIGQILRIPGIDGAFIKIASGDTLESIAKKYDGNVADILDLNSDVLDYRDPKLAAGMEIFIPNGVIPTPPPQRRVTYASRRSSSTVSLGDPGGISVPSGTLVHPLSYCSGWGWSRGFSAWHGGVDMWKMGGCWTNSSGAGRVTKAGWSGGGLGFNVIVDHGNGLQTRYYHGSGSFAVKAGDYVKAGQKIMYMGSSGYSTGTHLHFEVRINGYKVNPERYVRLR